MKTDFRFYKELFRWYIDLPQWTGPKEDLEMVSGADALLEILADGHYEVYVKFTDQPFEGCHTLTNKGDGFYTNDAWHGPSLIWLCYVTEFVFSRYPDKIYYARL